MVLQDEGGSLHPYQGRAVELGEYLCVHQVQVALHNDLSGNEPLVGDMDGHGVVTHEFGRHVVAVQLQCGELPYQRVLAGGYQKVAFAGLGSCVFGRYCAYVTVEFGTQGVKIRTRLSHGGVKTGPNESQYCKETPHR